MPSDCWTICVVEHSYISLCSGIAGLDLGVQMAFPEFRCICYCENNTKAAERLCARMRDGSIDAAPIWDDLKTFPSHLFRGRTSAVVVGWPCQQHSVAGKRKGTGDERWIWGDIVRILRECGAWLFLGENVSGLLRDTDSPTDQKPDVDEFSADAIGGMGTVLRDLAEMGFVAAWGCIRASDVGAAHGRPRVFILAYRDGGGPLDALDGRERGEGDRQAQPAGNEHYLEAGCSLAYRESGGLGIDGDAPGQCGHANECHGDVADSENSYRRWPGGRAGSGSAGEAMADSEHARLIRRGAAHDDDRRDASRHDADGCSAELAHSSLTGLEKRREPGEPGSSACAESEPVLLPAGPGIFAPGPSDPSWPAILESLPHLAPAMSAVERALALAVLEGWSFSEWEMAAGGDVSEEALARLRLLADGSAAWLAGRRDRLAQLGNAVVPLQCAAAFRELGRRLGILSRFSAGRMPRAVPGC